MLKSIIKVELSYTYKTILIIKQKWENYNETKLYSEVNGLN